MVQSILLKMRMLYGIEITAKDTKEIRALLQQHRMGDALDTARIKQFLVNDLASECERVCTVPVFFLEIK